MKYLFLLFACSVLLSCGTYNTINPLEEIDSEARFRAVGSKKMYEETQKRNPYFKTLQISRFNLKIDAGESSKSFKGSLRIERDRVIYLTIIPAMGVEMFRLKLTPDSLMFIDRFNKQYYAGDLSLIEDAWGVELDFNTVQSFLCHQLFAYPSKRSTDKDIKDYRVRRDSNGYNMLSPEARVYSRSRKENIHSQFRISPSFILLRSELSDRISNRGITVEYKEVEKIDAKDYPRYGGTIFPRAMDIHIEGSKTMSLIEVTFKSPRFDKKLSLPFTIPEKYERIELDLTR